MGGRGAASGMSVSGHPYGTEFETVLTDGNIKFIRHKNGSTTAPLETMTKGRVYVTVHDKYGPAFITYHDSVNHRSKTIDLQHYHNGLKPHVHHGYLHNENDGVKGATRLNPDEQRMVDRVMQTWYANEGRL